MVDGIIFNRPRTVPAVALYLEMEVDIVLFAGLHSQQQAFAFFGFKIARVGVDAGFGINPVAMVFGKPLHAVAFAAFFIRSERQDEITRRNPAFFFQADKVRDQDRVALFNVRSSAAIKKAIHLIELEWVHGPILRQGLYHVEVGDKQDWLVGAASVQTHYKVLLVRQRAINVDILSRKTSSSEASGHRLCCSGYVAG